MRLNEFAHPERCILGDEVLVLKTLRLHSIHCHKDSFRFPRSPDAHKDPASDRPQRVDLNLAGGQAQEDRSCAKKPDQRLGRCVTEPRIEGRA